ncbi:hypothetical protein [Fundidesulfovibrio soli]|uniref:hypothetical protein n=1 Tax=Fundidesulfovibrio soli TaxID=2922716 RepID=UPI001FAEE895|nr:hypothetical protein [Fundidesulfovibrio soli]
MRNEKELRDNLAAYWRRLNAACGLPDGTHPDDPNPAGTAYQRQPQYSHAATASAHGPMPSFRQIHNALLGDPEAMAIFQDHWNDTFVPNDRGLAPANPEAQLRWYVLRDLNDHHHKRHKADFEDARKFRTRQRVERLFERLAVIDPLYALTREVMEFYAGRLAPFAKHAMQQVPERSPHDAIKLYYEMRRLSEQVVAKQQNRLIRSSD